MMLMKLAIRRLTLGVICLRPSGVVHAELASSTKPSALVSDNRVVMREHAVHDPGLNNIVASTVLVPEGWTLEGGITRTSSQLYNIQFRFNG